MNVSFDRGKLASTLSFVKSSLPKKEVEPILNNFYFKTLDEGWVQIVSSDLDLMAVAKIKGTVTEAGAVTIPGEKLLSLVGKLSTEEISFNCQDNSINIVSGAYKGEFKTPGTDDFPEIYKITENLEGKKFKREPMLLGLKRIFFAVSQEEAKKQLMAVQLSSKGMVATNGKVTAIYREPFDVAELCISSNCLKDLISVMEASVSEELEVFEDESYLIFKFGENLFFTRKTNVKFPEVFSTLDVNTDKNCTQALIFKTKDLMSVIRRVSLTASEETRSIIFEPITPDEIKISARDTKDFSSEEIMKYSSENLELDPETPVQIIINFANLLEILSKLAGEEVKIKMNYKNLRLPLRVDEAKITILFMRSLM